MNNQELKEVLWTLYILKPIYERLLEQEIIKPIGLCRASFCNRNISSKQYTIFKNYYRQSTIDQKWYYTHNGTEVLDDSQFAWPPTEAQPRLDWINANIELLESNRTIF